MYYRYAYSDTSFKRRETTMQLLYRSRDEFEGVSLIMSISSRSNYHLDSPGGSLSHISATHPCAHTSKSALKWRNTHHQILHP